MNEEQPLIPIAIEDLQEFFSDPGIIGAIAGAGGSALLSTLGGQTQGLPLSMIAGGASGYLSGKLYENLTELGVDTTTSTVSSVILYVLGRKIINWLLR